MERMENGRMFMRKVIAGTAILSSAAGIGGAGYAHAQSPEESVGVFTSGAEAPNTITHPNFPNRLTVGDIASDTPQEPQSDSYTPDTELLCADLNLGIVYHSEKPDTCTPYKGPGSDADHEITIETYPLVLDENGVVSHSTTPSSIR